MEENKQEIKQLENQLMNIGMNGMAYSEVWNEKAKRLNKLKRIDKEISRREEIN